MEENNIMMADTEKAKTFNALLVSLFPKHPICRGAASSGGQHG